VTYSENIETVEKICLKLLDPAHFNTFSPEQRLSTDQYLKVLEILATVSLAQATQLSVNRR
jgi:hypothetical protein